MILKLGVFLAVFALFCAALFFARREGKKAEQVANLRRELERQAKEREKYDKVVSSVGNMSDSDVANRLQNVASKQR